MNYSHTHSLIFQSMPSVWHLVCVKINIAIINGSGLIQVQQFVLELSINEMFPVGLGSSFCL